MAQPHHRTEGRPPLAAAVLLGAGTLAADLLLPLGVAGGIPYVLLVLLGLRHGGHRFLPRVAAAATVLTLLGALLSPRGGGVLWMAVVNRLLTVAMIWTATLVLLRYRRTQQALAGERKMVERYLEIAEVAILVLNHEAEVLHINRKGAEILGCLREEVIGKNWIDSYIPERQREEVRAVFRSIMAGGEAPQSYENAVRTAGGEERLIAWRNAYLRDEHGRPVGTISSGEDVTERKRARDALRESVKQLEDLKYALDQAAIVAVTDRRGKITFVNDKFCEISQYAREELVGRNHRIVNSGMHSKEFFHQLWETIGRGEIWRGEIRNRKKDGSVYWVDTTIVPFLDERGVPYQYMAIRSDITERKKAQEQLRSQRALAQVGQMAAQVAHEVKNPLAGISGALQIIERRLPEDHPNRSVIGEILARIDGLNDWVQELLVFSRPVQPEFAEVDAMPLLQETVALLRRDPKFRGVEVSLTGDPVVLTADHEMLRGVLVNMLLNAAQAINGDGRIEVNLSGKGDRCDITIRDSGPGIPEDARERIFEPFFTTKTQGSGLGLAVARRAVESHDGEIEVECPAGGGTVMTVSLPLTRSR